jgi:hypothetical protein
MSVPCRRHSTDYAGPRITPSQWKGGWTHPPAPNGSAPRAIRAPYAAAPGAASAVEAPPRQAGRQDGCRDQEHQPLGAQLAEPAAAHQAPLDAPLGPPAQRRGQRAAPANRDGRQIRAGLPPGPVGHNGQGRAGPGVGPSGQRVCPRGRHTEHIREVRAVETMAQVQGAGGALGGGDPGGGAWRDDPVAAHAGHGEPFGFRRGHPRTGRRPPPPEVIARDLCCRSASRGRRSGGCSRINSPWPSTSTNALGARQCAGIMTRIDQLFDHLAVRGYS